MWFFSLSFACVLSQLSASNMSTTPWNDEQRLLADILDGPGRYDRRARPVADATIPVEVYVAAGLDIFEILNLNTKNLDLHSIMSFSVQWRDERLRWETSDYGGVEYLAIDVKSIWYPKIVVINSDFPVEVITEESTALLASSGTVHATIFTSLYTKCLTMLAKFPFDSQVCKIMVGTTSAPIQQIRVTGLMQGEEERFRTSVPTDWVIQSVSIQPFAMSCDNFHVNLTGEVPSLEVMQPGSAHCLQRMGFHIYVTIKRMSAFYVVTVILPTSALTLIVSLMFLLPPECGEKLSFGVSLLLGVVVFQLVVQGAIPDGGAGSLPILITFTGSCFAMAIVAILWTAVTLTLHHRSENKQKAPLRCTTLFLRTTNKVQNLRKNAEEQEEVDGEIQTQEEIVGVDWKGVARWLDRVGFALFLTAYIVTHAVLYSEAISN